jgi:glutaredoxin 3
MKNVTIYTTPTCGFCHMTKDYFRSKDVKFKEVDVSQDVAAAQYMVKRTGQMGVPVIEVDEDYVVGFDKPKLDTLLGL